MRPKLLIQKKFWKPSYNNPKGWTRFYTQAKIDLNESQFYTEKQLCRFIFNNFGEGHYMVSGFVKGRKGFWLFWKGDIESRGFQFETKKLTRSGDLKYLIEEYHNPENREYRDLLKKEIEEEMTETKKYRGFKNHLSQSGRKGQFIFWEDCF